MLVVVEDSYLYDREEEANALRLLEGDLKEQVVYGMNIIDGIEVKSVRLELLREEE